MSVAQTILAQLGGNRFIAMTGAKRLSSTSTSLDFRLPGQGGKTRGMMIRLDPSDTYTVRILEMRGMQITRQEDVSDVYCDNLRDVFTRLTGLATSL